MECVFIGSCVENPFPTVEDLTDVIDSAREVIKRTFQKRCAIDFDLKVYMNLFPHDYTFWKSRYKGKVVYFYEWSMMEYFYMERR